MHHVHSSFFSVAVDETFSSILEWPQIIYNDGLMTANQLLSQDCLSCNLSGQKPSLKNVIFVSVQPERNIQLFPQLGTFPMDFIRFARCCTIMSIVLKIARCIF